VASRRRWTGWRSTGGARVRSSAETAQAQNKAHPIGRLGKPEDIAGGVVVLASSAASFMTCDELVIDGGFSQV